MTVGIKADPSGTFGELLVGGETAVKFFPNSTTSPIDTTSGRVLEVGDFGIGGDAISISGRNANDAVLGSIMEVSGVNSEAAGFNWPVLPIAGASPVWWNFFTHGNPGRISQIATQAYDVYGTAMYIRRKHDAVWGAWREVYNAERIVRAVSQSGGIPTGGIIERGSNANGDYVRLADGTQICRTRTIVTSAVSGVPWTFPAAFIAEPVCSATARVDGPIFANFGSTSGTGIANVNAWLDTGTRTAVGVEVYAIGHWF